MATLLIVEDDGLIGAYLSASLRRLGYAVAGCYATGEAAVAAAGELRPDLVLMDIALAGALDGVAAADAIRRQYDLPVVFLTAHADAETLARAKIAEPFGYLTKPFQEASLQSTIEVALYRHALNQRLKESEARYHLVADHTADWVYWEGPDGVWRYCSPSCAWMTGRPPEAFLADPALLPRLIHPDDQALFERHQRAAQLTAAEQRLEFRLGMPDGTVRWLEQVGRPMQDAAGRYQGRRVSNRDITERKQLELDVQTERDFALSVMNAMGQGLTVTDDQMRFEYINPAYAAFTGYQPQDLLGQTPLAVTVTADQAGLDRSWAERQAGKTTTYESRLRHADGRVVEVLVTGAPRWRAGQVAGTIAVITDLTEQKRAEAALRQANEQLRAALGELAEHNQQLRAVNRLVEALQLVEDPRHAYQTIAAACQADFQVAHGLLAVREITDRPMTVMASWGALTGADYEPAACRAYLRGELRPAAELPCLCADAGQTLCLPLAAHGHIYGFLRLGLPPAADTDVLRNLAPTLGETLGLTLANLRLRLSLRDQSIRDPLTGVFNRRYMEETLQRELDRAERQSQPLAALILDCDYFKQFNDVYGHAAGDAVLRALAGLLTRQVRGSDIVCRYGGEEFVVILPEAPPLQAARRAQALCRTARRLKVTHAGQILPPVTISIGVAAYPRQAASAAALLAAADAALYAAKQAGRDRVGLAPRPRRAPGA